MKTRPVTRDRRRGVDSALCKDGIGQDNPARTGQPRESGIGRRYSSCLGTGEFVSVNQLIEKG